jgi:hypothetical protein
MVFPLSQRLVAASPYPALSSVARERLGKYLIQIKFETTQIQIFAFLLCALKT